MEPIKNRADLPETYNTPPERLPSQETSFYNLIHSKELDLLYVKNAHLLDRLSKTGRENAKLYTKLSSLQSEKSRLNDTNEVLKNKVLNLKGQISLFARQHREFNRQSMLLKMEWQKLKKLPSSEQKKQQAAQQGKQAGDQTGDQTGEISTLEQILKDKDRQLHLLQKKEQVYQKQISTLQKGSQKNSNQQKILQKRQAEKQENKFQQAQSQWQKAAKAYREREVFLEEELERKSQQALLALESLEQLKAENFTLRQKADKSSEKIQGLKEQNQSLKEESRDRDKEIRALKKELSKFRKKEERLSTYKSQAEQFKKEKESQAASFTHRLDLFAKDKEAIAAERDRLSQALSFANQGFEQAMLSFQRRYAVLYRQLSHQKKELETERNKVQGIAEAAQKMRELTFQEKQKAEDKIKALMEARLSKLTAEFNGLKEHNRGVEAQLRKLKTQGEEALEKEKSSLRYEMENLQRKREQNFLKEKERQIKELESLRSSYEGRIKSMESVFQSKLRHIRIELENDLCSERRRYEIFKNMKNRQLKEIEEGTGRLKTKNQELLLKTSLMERSLSEQSSRLTETLKQNERLKDQNSSLENLWRSMQSQQEDREQRIEALQKLNKALSLSCNQMKQQRSQQQNRGAETGIEEKRQAFKNTPPTLKGDAKIPSQEQQRINHPSAFNHILADIHFD